MTVLSDIWAECLLASTGNAECASGPPGDPEIQLTGTYGGIPQECRVWRCLLMEKPGNTEAAFLAPLCSLF